MFPTIALRAASLRRTMRRTWIWMRLHPRKTALLVVALWYLISVACTASLAMADTGSGIASLPFLPPQDIKDSNGVSLLHYVTLPLDRGDVWTWQKTFWTSGVDVVWIIHLTMVAWVLWQIQFLLSFQWVDWLAAPIGTIATLVHNVVATIGWIPLALAVTALVCGIAFWTGRMAKSLVEVGVSVFAAVLAVTILANPVSALTGPNGALNWAQRWGGSIAASIASNDTTLSTSPPTTEDASRILNEAISAQLMDIFVRLPAQEITFGHDLTGQCNRVFTQQMEADNPIDTSSTTVRDAVGQCDPVAKEYVSSAGPAQLMTALIDSIGSLALNLLSEGLAIVLIMTVFSTLWQAIKAIGAVNAAVLPGVARQSLWRSFIGIYVGVFSVGLIIIVFSGFLRIIVDVMTTASQVFGSDITTSLGILDLIVIVLIVSLFVVRHKAKKAGEKMADRIARLGFGSPDRQPNKILQSAQRVGENYLASHMRWPGRSKKAPAVVEAAARQPVDGGFMRSAPYGRGTGAEALGELTAGLVPTPGAPGGAGGAALASIGSGKSAGMITAGVQLAAAVGSGGTSAMFMTATKIAGKTVLQRAAASGTSKAMGERRASSPAFTGYGRQIVVDGQGRGSIAPAQAPSRKQVYNVTALPPRGSSVAGSELRKRLAAAATGAGR